MLQKGKPSCEMLLAAAMLDAVFQPSFKIREEPCAITRNKNNLEENVVCPGSACEPMRGNINIWLAVSY